MRDVYDHARRVIVWLDVDSWGKLGKHDELSVSFEQIRKLATQVQSAYLEHLWSLPGMWRENLKTILHLPWWNRVWIIQEATSNCNVIVQCHEHTAIWDDLRRVVLQPQASNYLDVNADLRRFVSRIQELQRSATDPAYGLLSLTDEFRHSEASEERDKLYALRGLVKTDRHQLQLTVDYQKKNRRHIH